VSGPDVFSGFDPAYRPDDGDADGDGGLEHALTLPPPEQASDADVLPVNDFGFTLRPEGPALTGVDRAWDDLAIAAEFAGASATGRALAACINDNRHVDQFLPAIATMLHDTVERLAGTGETDGDTVERLAGTGETDGAPAERLSELLVHLNTSILVSALRTELNQQRRGRLVKNAIRVLTIRATLRLAQAASAAYDEPFSRPLRRLLRKLAREAVTTGTLVQPEAQRLFRHIVVRKFEKRAVRHGDPVTLGFKDVFAEAPPRRAPGKATPEAERLMQTAMEIDAVGEAVWVAATEMIDDGQQRDLIALLKGASPTARVPRLVLGRIAHQPLLTKLLQEDPVDFELVDLLLDHMGVAAAKVLLEELAESRSRVTRREVFQRVVRLGPAIGPLLEVRLKDRRWFVLRNMIALAREAGCLLDWHIMQPFLGHADARVRREALHLLIRHDVTYEHAVTKALEDTDRNVLRIALQAARSRLPESAVPVLADRVTRSDFPPEFRVLALHLLGRSSNQVALEALLRFAQNGKTILGRPKLAPKSPEMLAALSNLARTWPGERRVAALLASAAHAKDAEAADAARIVMTGQ
jgi:hypothetical protein